MTDSSPHVFILHGEDEFGIAQFLADHGAAQRSATQADLNVTHLDGRSLSLDEFVRVTSSMPMFAERKTVVVAPLGNLAALAHKASVQSMLNQLPSSTQLFLVEYQPVKAGHWLLEWAKGTSDRSVARLFPLKKGYAMERWIMEQVQAMGGDFAPGSAEMLSALVGTDARLAHQEILKLLTFSGFERPVYPEDVEMLCAYLGQGNIFALVDAIGNMEGKKAQALLRKLMEEDDPRRIFGMIVRQFRLVLLAREILDNGGRQAGVMEQLHLRDFIAEKIITQARKYTLEQLESSYRRLLVWDESIKSGYFEDEVMLDVVALEFTSWKQAPTR